MTKRLVAFVVGHENWGKSYTLRALKEICGHRARQRRAKINGREIRVRSSSNDDIIKKRPKSYINFMASFSSPYLIAALCPKFKRLGNCDDPSKLADEILRGLRARGYRLFFWVIEHKWDSEETIHQGEIRELKKYGAVKIFRRVDAEDRARAREFRRFFRSLIRRLSDPPVSRRRH